MQAMRKEPQTVTQAQIDSAGLLRVHGGAAEIATLAAQNLVHENTSVKCLICLEDWESASDDCRLLSCKHLFHT